MSESRCRECHYVWIQRRSTQHCPACASIEICKISGDYWRSYQFRGRWDQMIKTLSKRPIQTERLVIKLLYGLEDDDGYCYTAAQVAKIFKRSVKEIRQIEAKAIRKLRQPVRARKANELGLLSKYAQITMAKGMASLARQVAARG